jgi:hypothetical protein
MFLLIIGLVVYLAFSLRLTLVLCSGATLQTRREAPARTVQNERLPAPITPMSSVMG